MDKNIFINVDFWNAKWPTASLPSKFSKLVRGEFLFDSNDKFLPKDEMKVILTSWLHDEFGDCPIDFDFMVVP